LIEAPELPIGPGDAERRRKARRTALVLGFIALTFYVSFILMSVVRAHR
jgi:uncharacterized membrane protein (DUF485 family)